VLRKSKIKKTKFIVLTFECSCCKLNLKPTLRQCFVPTLSIGKRQSLAKYNPEVN